MLITKTNCDFDFSSRYVNMQSVIQIVIPTFLENSNEGIKTNSTTSSQKVLEDCYFAKNIFQISILNYTANPNPVRLTGNSL